MTEKILKVIIWIGIVCLAISSVSNGLAGNYVMGMLGVNAALILVLMVEVREKSPIHVNLDSRDLWAVARFLVEKERKNTP